MKSCSPMHIKTVILLGNFCHLVCLMLLICQQRSLFNVCLRFFYFFIENAFFNVFYSWGQRFFYIYGILWTHVDKGRGQKLSVSCGSPNSLIKPFNSTCRCILATEMCAVGKHFVLKILYRLFLNDDSQYDVCLFRRELRERRSHMQRVLNNTSNVG